MATCRIASFAVFYFVCVSIHFSASAYAQQVDVKADSRFNALAWVQNSAEYSMLAEQSYRHAMSQLTVGRQDRAWSADEVQMVEGGFEEKPAAVILDCDETVLDNSAYNARNIVTGNPYSTPSWNAWCQEGRAGAIPGALNFVVAAQGLGVKVFYITNRSDVVKEATIKNLNQLGFKADESNVLTKNAELGRGDDKVSRRAAVAKDYRIVLLIGDSMSDLCSGLDAPSTRKRNEVAAKKIAMLGSRWIMMPNPVYGGWERVIPKDETALDTKPKPAESPAKK
jgi:acid phosphatase